MTVYEKLTNKINSYIGSCFENERDGDRCDVLRDQIQGMSIARDDLTIKAAECLV